MNNLLNVVHVDVDNQQRDIASDSPYYTLNNIGNILSEHKNKICMSKLYIITVYLNQNISNCDYSDYSVNMENESSGIWDIHTKDPVTNKNIEIVDIYRPPKDNNSNENVNLFIQEITTIIQKLNKSQSLSVLVGDFNLDLLKIIKEKPVFNDFLENMLSYGFNPKLIYQPD